MFATKLKIYCFIAYMDLYYTGCIVYIYYRIVGSLLIMVYNQLYDGNNYL